MESKFINRYHSFCNCIANLEKCKRADSNADFVLEATVQIFNLTFDLSWKVMKDILIKKLGILDFAIGSPRETLQAAFTNGLISDDVWLQMLRTRTHLAHDYDGTLASASFGLITGEYYDAFYSFKQTAKKYYSDDSLKIDSFR